MRTLLAVLKKSVMQFFEDDCFRLSAALSFYAVLSLAPLTVVALWVADVLWGSHAARAEMIRWVTSVFGTSAADVVDTVVQRAGEASYTGIAALAAVAALIFGATTVFHNLQDALNRVWNVEDAPGRMVRGFVRKRVISLLMIVAIGIFLVASIIASSLLSSMLAHLPAGVPWRLLNIGFSLILFTALFAAAYRVLPDVDIAWRDVAHGALLTAGLFVLGKELAALYMARAGVGSAYGAAGSLVVLLFWVYYSSIILFLGAEITQVMARQLGREIRPGKRAVSRHGPGPDREPAEVR
jgi:membrane protein